MRGGGGREEVIFQKIQNSSSSSFSSSVVFGHYAQREQFYILIYICIWLSGENHVSSNVFFYEVLSSSHIARPISTQKHPWLVCVFL